MPSSPLPDPTAVPPHSGPLGLSCHQAAECPSPSTSPSAEQRSCQWQWGPPEPCVPLISSAHPILSQTALLSQRGHPDLAALLLALGPQP